MLARVLKVEQSEAVDQSSGWPICFRAAVGCPANSARLREGGGKERNAQTRKAEGCGLSCKALHKGEGAPLHAEMWPACADGPPAMRLCIRQAAR